MNEKITARLKEIVHELAQAGAEFVNQRPEHGRDCIRSAGIKIAALRVALDQALGPKKLPRRRA